MVPNKRGRRGIRASRGVSGEPKYASPTRPSSRARITTIMLVVIEANGLMLGSKAKYMT